MSEVRATERADKSTLQFFTHVFLHLGKGNDASLCIRKIYEVFFFKFLICFNFWWNTAKMAKIREIKLIGFSGHVFVSYTDSHCQSRARSNTTHTYLTIRLTV